MLDRSRSTPLPRLPRLRTLVLVLGMGAALPAAGQRTPGEAADPFTLRPERTGWQETSRYAEVVAFLERAAASHPRMHFTTFGYTNQGRALPLLVVGPDDPAAATPGAVRDSGVLRVYVQGNIHAGEVAGKEALLRLVRRLVQGESDGWTRDWVLLLAPVYNADGNEAVALGNRPRQHGPLGGMGTRANAQGLDLNRDQMKLDSPEARSLARLLTEWDPHVVVDLHVTNGTRHAYHLTYAPGLHPATPEGLDRYLRDDLLPEVTRAVETARGWHMWHYGNVGTRDGVRGWWTFDHRARFVTNYAGIRNRLGILSEAYSYLTFEDRVLATEAFVDEVLTVLHRDREGVRRRVEEAVAADIAGLPGRTVPLRAELPTDAPVHEILMGAVAEEAHPWTGEVILRRLDVVTPDPMPAGVAFRGAEGGVAPEAYLLPPEGGALVARLAAHGIRVDTLDAPWEGPVERFRVDALRVAERPFQGRNEQEVDGAWETGTGALPAGAFRVPVRQALGRLAVILLEPRADDGFLNWGIVEVAPDQGSHLPVWREPAR
jgi:hypothetical protein